MGVLLGYVLYLFGYDLMIILRQGVACNEMGQMVLSGMPLEDAVSESMGEETGAAFLQIVQGPQGPEYLGMAQAVDVFSRYGVIFLLFHVGLDTCVAELRQVHVSRCDPGGPPASASG